ncbi:hypothetical protein H9P43_005258 [Blastocladiella emersonii ATCC 22665]|nr:hypothetical protein H9P43_005258 [Blastocladiella emersonii ATCC 22665]
MSAAGLNEVELSGLIWRDYVAKTEQHPGACDPLAFLRILLFQARLPLMFWSQLADTEPVQWLRLEGQSIPKYITLPQFLAYIACACFRVEVLSLLLGNEAYQANEPDITAIFHGALAAAVVAKRYYELYRVDRTVQDRATVIFPLTKANLARNSPHKDQNYGSEIRHGVLVLLPEFGSQDSVGSLKSCRLMDAWPLRWGATLAA